MISHAIRYEHDWNAKPWNCRIGGDSAVDFSHSGADEDLKSAGARKVCWSVQHIDSVKLGLLKIEPVWKVWHCDNVWPFGIAGQTKGTVDRSEERRVGKEGRSRWEP